MSRRYPDPYETYPPEDRRPYSSSRSGSSYNQPRRPSSEWHRDSYYDDRPRYDREDYRDAYARDEYDRGYSRREVSRDPYDDRYRSYAAGYDRGEYDRAVDRRYPEYRAAEPRRSRSPYTRGDSPSYASRPSGPVSPLDERREGAPRRTSHYVEPQRSRQESHAISRDENIPTGPRSGTGAPPPTGPKALLGRRIAPAGPSAADYKERYSDSPKRLPGEDSRRTSNEITSLDRREGKADNQMRGLPSTGAAPLASYQSEGRESAEKNSNEPKKIVSDSWSSSSVDVMEGKSEISRPAPLATTAMQSETEPELELRVEKKTPIADKLGNLTGQDFPHHACPNLEAEAFNAGTVRLRKETSLYASPQYVAYRQALVGLADSDIELVGARTRSSITTEALQRAKEDAEAWSLESARIEASEKNMDTSSFFSHQPISTVR